MIISSKVASDIELYRPLPSALHSKIFGRRLISPRGLVRSGLVAEPEGEGVVSREGGL